MRLLVHVEGETEETFINEVLGPYLLSNGYSKVSARLIGNARQRSQRGGIKAWQTVRKEIMNHLRADRQSVATTMIDYYGLPQRGSGAWPSRATAGSTSPLCRVIMVVRLPGRPGAAGQVAAACSLPAASGLMECDAG